MKNSEKNHLGSGQPHVWPRSYTITKAQCMTLSMHMHMQQACMSITCMEIPRHAVALL